MAEETQYTVITGQVNVSTANGNLDGTGALGTLITGASNGTLVKTVIITAQSNVTQGMIRLFVYNGTNSTILIAEIEVPAVTGSARDELFSTSVPIDLHLQSGYVLKVSTQNAETFSVIAEALNWTYYAPSVRTDTTMYTANTGIVTISTANVKTDGSGAMGTVLTAGAAASFKGCKIDSITVKAVGNTTPGMVRIWAVNTAATVLTLISEIPVPYTTPSFSLPSFNATITFDDGYNIQAGYKIYASTQNAEAFVITAEARDWNYLP